MLNFIWVLTISWIPDRRTKKPRIPCPNFGESRLPGSSQIQDRIKIYIFFMIPALFFGEIPDLKNTLPDPVKPDGQNHPQSAG